MPGSPLAGAGIFPMMVMAMGAKISPGRADDEGSASMPLDGMIRSKIGDAPKRREDLRFLTGRGRYLDDLLFDRLVHAVVLRSPHAHALIRGIDTGAGRAAPGVLAVLTAADALEDGLLPLQPGATTNTVTGEAFAFEPQPLLAVEKVRHVGEAVALVVAETRDQALDAAELIVVDYQPLPAVTTAAAARAADAPVLSDKAPGNLCLDWRHGDDAAADAAFARAAHVATVAVDNHRVVTNPMEPRGIVATYDEGTGRYVAHV
ncbi:MAG TPA: molybdopterin cofactor-binding domain-containing protein, partial [Stellaceae bacterium]|nr:molybdopterin cofactor-binding domain-containing protein [Stellaceae bacterium]